MKSGITAVVLAGVVVVAGITYSFLHASNTSINEDVSAAAKPNGASRIIHVDELAKDPEDFRDEFMLSGVVAGVNKSEKMFAVIDSREFESCGELTCAANTIPVKLNSDDMPRPKSVVIITGKLVQSDKGFVIKAKRVEVVK